MAKNWVLNAKYFKMRQGETDSSEIQIDIISRWANIGISKEDNYILLKEYKLKKFVFEHYGKVKKVANPIPLPFSAAEERINRRREALGLLPWPHRNKHTIKISPKQDLKENNRFDDFAYSLLTVENHLKPISHFRRQYREICDADFETIKKGWIYISRTAFGKFANAMPQENKMQFMLYVTEKYNTISFKDIDYSKLFDYLYNYIEGHILSQGKLLVETKKILKKELSDPDLKIPVEEIGFVDEERGTYDLVQEQAERFQTLFDLDPAFTLKKRIEKEIQQNKQEPRFYEVFKDKTWPLHI
ncbi:MAG: hypothetical protein JSV88_10125 [Candidatus Aminicenantes bacterium]|nr:MAG: hypothetical protein JSV88_10125 [Candidatus Aminicenantes bacterium]